MRPGASTTDLNHLMTAPAVSSVERALFPSASPSADFDLAESILPEPRRGQAELGVLDITKWFGETSGGVRTYLLQKAQYVEARPTLRHVLVIPGAKDSITTGNGVRCYRLRGPRIPTQHPYRFMLATRSIRRIVEHERPDIIEVGSPFLVPWITRRAARRYDVPLVGFFHSNFPRAICAFPERTGGVRRRAHDVAWRYVRRLNEEFEVTIVASRFMVDDLRRHGVERVERVPLGVDLDHFHPRRRADAARTRERLGLSADAPIAAFIGRFAREKEVDLLLRAWEQIEKRTDAFLVLVGDGPARRRLQEQGRDRRIVWMPYQNDREELANLIAAVDLVVSPGSIETFGLSPLEAAASGTPVLAADRGGVAEQIAASGGGAVFTAGDAGALADVGTHLLRNASDLPRLGALGRAYAEREHSWSSVFDRVFDIYRRVVA
jgi:alpha-1,6-mannosyltransferase